MNTVSIITPLYHGKKYIPKLREMINECAKANGKDISLEWIISNDDPNEYIDESLSDDLYSIKVLNTDVNRGIQGARVTGFHASKGDYVLFLDQDDYIVPKYFLSQMKHIGDADAVVCSYTRDGREFYNTWMRRASLDECITEDFNLHKICGFIPGQVLMRGKSIPDLWKRRWLRYNCCDDYFLWLYMFSVGAKFVANHEKLYDHRTSGNNQGANTYVWYKSTIEMMSIVKEEHLFGADEIDTFFLSRQEEIDLSILDKVWLKHKFNVYGNLLTVYEKDYYISSVLSNMNATEVA